MHAYSVYKHTLRWKLILTIYLKTWIKKFTAYSHLFFKALLPWHISVGEYVIERMYVCICVCACARARVCVYQS
jgi:hypothetical protein